MNILVIGIGNPSRGDDALGPLFIDRLAERDIPGVELLTDFQLQVEYVLDLHGRDAVIFADASVNCVEPYAFSAACASEGSGFTTHSMSPEALLGAYRAHFECAPPAAYIMAIRGYRFELGEELSTPAARNIDAAVAFLATTIRTLITPSSEINRREKSASTNS